MVWVDLDQDVQAVVAQYHLGWCGFLAIETNELFGMGQAGGGAIYGDCQLVAVDGIRFGVGMRTVFQGSDLVQEVSGPSDDFVAADRVIGITWLSAAFLRDGVCAVQGVVQRTPTRISCVQCKSCVEDWNDKLWASDFGDF